MSEPESSPILTEDGWPPRSRLYDDLYFSREDGLGEARAVFLHGCGLPERWAGRARFTVGELGFGTGLNVVALLDLWRATRPPGGHLSIFSVEAHPLSAGQAAAALGRWPELTPIAELVVGRWPGERAGFHRLDLPELHATLDVAMLEASAALGAWSGHADAWFLDGFAPARNPAMWTDSLMRQVAARSAPGAVAATYTVAGQVRRALAAAGFAVERRPGFGRKRERLEAVLPPGGESEIAERGETIPTVAIVGAGVAGAALARAFAALGVEARVFESVAAGAGASGNPAAVVTPRLDAGLGPGAQLHAQAFARAVQLYERVPAAVLSRGGLQLQVEARDGARFGKIAAGGVFEPGAVVPLTAEAAGETLGEPAPAGLRFPDALVVEPLTVLGAWLPGTETGRVDAIRPSAAGWRLLDANGSVLAEVDLVCLAAGADLAALWPQAPVLPVRGQLSWVRGADAPIAVSWGGYAAPMAGGVMFGATHDRGDSGADWRAADDQRNLAELAGRLPRLAARLQGRAVEGRASVRAVVADNFPIVGQAAPGLFLLGALGGRGFTLAPLLAEHLAALALGAPSPLPGRLSQLLAPGRFAERVRRRTHLSSKPGTS